MSEREPVCFTCGSNVETAFENVLPDGRPCSTCRQRAMEALPALLPSSSPVEHGETLETVASEDEETERAETRLHLLPNVDGTSDDGPVRA